MSEENMHADAARRHFARQARADAARARVTSESAFQAAVLDLCDWLRLKWHHETDSRRSKAGFPDLVIAGPGGVIFAELKKEDGRVSAAQQEWLDVLDAADAPGVEVYVWRPSDLDLIRRRLHKLAGRPLTPKGSTR